MRVLRPLGRAVLFALHLAALFALLSLALTTGCTHVGGGGERHPVEALHCADCHLSRERCRCACWSGATSPQDCTDG